MSTALVTGASGGIREDPARLIAGTWCGLVLSITTDACRASSC